MLYRGSTERMEVVLDTEEKVILVTQKWKCNFKNINLQTKEWTEIEKSYFKNQIRSLIQSLWSEKAYAIVNSQRGTHFNEMYGKTPFLIKINIEFVSGGEHWEVNINKITDITEDNPCVFWETRRAYLSNYSVYRTQYSFLRGNTEPGSYFWKAAHEFGHMLGNTVYIHEGTGDEYFTLHPLHRDVFSIMNVGCEIRHRHFAHVRDILQNMLPGTYFSIRLT